MLGDGGISCKATPYSRAAGEPRSQTWAKVSIAIPIPIDEEIAMLRSVKFTNLVQE